MLRLGIKIFRLFVFTIAIFSGVLAISPISAASPSQKPLNGQIDLNTTSIIGSDKVNSALSESQLVKEEDSSDLSATNDHVHTRESKSEHNTQDSTPLKQTTKNRTTLPLTPKKKNSSSITKHDGATSSERSRETTDTGHQYQDTNPTTDTNNPGAITKSNTSEKDNKTAASDGDSTDADENNAIENATAENDFGISVGAIRESAENNGKTEAEIREGLGKIVFNNATLNGDERNSESVREYLKNPSVDTLDREAVKTYAAENNIPIDKINKALSKDGKPAKFTDLSKIVSDLEVLGVSDDPSFDTSSPQFWDKITKEGVRQLKKDATGKALNLPENASKNPNIKAEELFAVVSELELLDLDKDSKNKAQSREFWDKVANKGVEQARKDAIGEAFGLSDRLVSDLNLSGMDLIKIVEAKLKQKASSLAREAARNAAINLALKDLSKEQKTLKKWRGKIPKDSDTSTTGLTDKIPGAIVGGGIPGTDMPGGISGTSSAGTSTEDSSIGVGAPVSGQAGSESNKPDTGFTADDNSANPDAETPRSSNIVVITHNEDGGFTATHYTIVDAGDGQTEAYWLDTETYTLDEGVLNNEREEKFANLLGDGVPAEGAYTTKYNEDENYTVLDNDDDKKENDGGDGSEKTDESTTPVPDGDNLHSTPGKLYEATGGVPSAPEPRKTDNLQKDQGQVKVPTGGEAEAPGTEARQYISAEDMHAIEQRLKGGASPPDNTQNLKKDDNGSDDDEIFNNTPVSSDILNSLQDLKSLQEKISNIQSTLNK